jgi:cystathionine beta-lyase
MLAVLKTGDEVLITDAIYRPTRRFCDRVLRRYGVGVTYYPPHASADDLMALCGPATRLIVMESPGSLTMEMADAPAIAAAARARGVLTLLDNTWAAGLWFRPLDHGVDISVQALTKYVGGHSDVFMGSAATADPALAAALDQGILDFGWAVSPEDAYMMLRGLRTLPTRLARHEQNALAVATWLATHPAVGQILYPALPDAPDHDLWKRDFTGAAGLFSFVLESADEPRKDRFLDALRLFGLGFSWGGFESLAVDCDPQFRVRKTHPCFEGPLIRLSIGLEDPADLIADLDQALTASA